MLARVHIEAKNHIKHLVRGVFTGLELIFYHVILLASKFILDSLQYLKLIDFFRSLRIDGPASFMLLVAAVVFEFVILGEPTPRLLHVH